MKILAQMCFFVIMMVQRNEKCLCRWHFIFFLFYLLVFLYDVVCLVYAQFSCLGKVWYGTYVVVKQQFEQSAVVICFCHVGAGFNNFVKSRYRFVDSSVLCIFESLFKHLQHLFLPSFLVY